MHHAREVNRARVLSGLDRGVPEAQIMAVFGIGRAAVWRTRAAYLQGGLDLALFDIALFDIALFDIALFDIALFDLARPGRPRRYGTAAEAQVTAPAFSAPPASLKRAGPWPNTSRPRGVSPGWPG